MENNAGAIVGILLLPLRIETPVWSSLRKWTPPRGGRPTGAVVG